MKIGTRSVLFGAHCFFIHPIFVLVAWVKLYGFPLDPRLWIAFFVHDLGYWGKPNMDGVEGETHVELGAKIMNVFGKRWSDFSKYHSRFYSKKDRVNPSRLCIADKLAITLEPSWLYLPRVNWSGEVHEYMQNSVDGKYSTAGIPTHTQIEWFDGMRDYLIKWVETHKDGTEDKWTPEVR